MRVVLALVMLAAAAGSAAAQDLSNKAFQIQYDDNGIRSLKRTGDVHDTDYILDNGRLGRLLVRYRTAVNGDWRELRELMMTGQLPGRSVNYSLGARVPTLTSRSTAAAATGAAGLRGLNDGLVPAAPAPAGGRAAGPGGQTPVFDAPVFTWAGSRGPSQWVQYTFPDDQEVSRVDVFWIRPPDSWRLVYQVDGEWKEVAARGAYGTTAGAYTSVEFTPVKTMAMRIEAQMTADATVSLAEWRVGGDPQIAPAADLNVNQSFALSDEALAWTVTLNNRGTRPVEIGDLAVPFQFAERTGARGDIYTKKLLRHAYVGGHGSFVYWQRSNGVGPYLVMTPGAGTKFEYYDSTGGMGTGGFGSFTPYVHAKAARAAAVASGGNWRLPVSGATVAPGATLTYTFKFRWARDFAGVRDVLFEEGKFDTSVVPGMVIPTDLPAMFSLRTRQKITAIEAEHPESTRIERVQSGGVAQPFRAASADTAVYRVRFSRLGENMLRVRHGDGEWTSLEFFVTEPLETVIKKRASFLVTHHQHTDPSKWYVGMYSDWDQKNEILRSPEDRDGLSAWLTDANDDAGNARPAFIASKNVFFPDQKEIQSLELYISKYLWGGMQMTDKEQYPYAIYGIPNFKANRASADPGRNGRAHVWRIYDYPHIVMLYYRMFHIAKFYPGMVKHLDAPTYLERAYRTAIAYWTVPMAVEKWSANAVGTMNEAFIPELIDTLEQEGKQEWADTLRGHWESKVERFVMKTPNLYGSEFAFDSTGFESTGAFAKYAITRNTESFRARVPADAARRFQDFQLLLNITDRGWIEPTYYQLGTDYRGNMTYLLSYMSQMGGWSIVDHALHFAADPTDYLRLGYASSLSSWALVNSGTEASGYGYWFPSKNNDGATGGGFMPEPIGRAWIGKQVPRGAWHYSAEEDVGYAGALRINATIVTRDPVFGEFAYGGVLTRAKDQVSVIPRDGLRVRVHVVRDKQRLHMELDHDGFAKEQPVIISDSLDRVQFTLENRTGGAHETGLWIAGLPDGNYAVSVDGRAAGRLAGTTGRTKVAIPVGAAPSTQITISRVR
ncbi:MAG TPA: DUF5695 domain-containing protein [Vicinamibacterales bacterium]|nr:DUF5695 domain-containing protein [Vicinamibacterales bacterium]